MFNPADNTSTQSGHRPGDLSVFEPAEQGVKNGFELQSGEMGAEAKVLADPEAEMVVGLTIDVELERTCG